MLQHFFLYLFESSICMVLFATLYKLILEKLTFFRLMRYYLISSLILSLIIPLLDFTILNANYSVVASVLPLNIDHVNELRAARSTPHLNQELSVGIFPLMLLIYMSVTVFFLVASFNALRLSRKLLSIRKFISDGKKVKEQDYWLIRVDDKFPAFSFFKYVFINKNIDKLNSASFETIKQHELIHVKQVHSFDIIFIELLQILFWFNPVLYLYKKNVNEVHEFIVDKELTDSYTNRKSYSGLLLKLATEKNNISPVTGFSSTQIQKRINMLNKQKSNTMKKSMFLLILPLVAVMLAFFSLSFKSAPAKLVENTNNEISKLTVSNIFWEGNTAFSDKELSGLLDIKVGNKYNHDLHRKVMGDDSKILALYMDNGYAFYKADIFEDIEDNKVSLTIQITEHNQAVIGKIAFTGNKDISDNTLCNILKIHEGDMFNRSSIISTIQNLNTIPEIKSCSTDLRVIPEFGKYTPKGYSIVNLEFVVSE